MAFAEMPYQTAPSRQWLTVVIVSPISCNHTAAIIERHCGCAPLHIADRVLSSSTTCIRVFPSRSRLLSHVLLSPSPRFSLRGQQKPLIEPRLTCLLNFLLSSPPQFFALARDRKREKSQSGKRSVARVTAKCFTDKYEAARSAPSAHSSLARLAIRSLDYHGNRTNWDSWGNSGWK